VSLLGTCRAEAQTGGSVTPSRSDNPEPSSGLVSRAPSPDGLESENLEPGVVHWMLTAILTATLVAGLFRVCKVLRNGEIDNPLRQAPQGMRPVECGGCHAMQYVPTHGRIFICFYCRAANRIPVLDQRAPEQPTIALVSAEGPLLGCTFRWSMDPTCFRFTEMEKGELSDAEVATRSAAIPIGLRRPRSNDGLENLATDDEEALAHTTNSLVASDVAGGTSGATILGRPIAGFPPPDDLQSNVSINSKRSKNSEEASLLPQCVVCLDAAGTVIMLPCAHGGVCEGCATRIVQNRASGGAHCPHCRADIDKLIKIDGVDHDLRQVRGVELRIPMARPLT